MNFPGIPTALAALILVCSLSTLASELSQEKSREQSREQSRELSPELRETCLKTRFYVRPAWDDAIESLVSELRERINKAHLQGKIVLYISMPLTPSNGGLREFNKYLGEQQKKRLIRQHADTSIEVILPGQIETKLPEIEELSPQGGEYMYMWTQVLAGEDCSGDIDWIYFMDFTDIHFFMGLNNLPDAQKRMKFEKLLGHWAHLNPEIYNKVYTTPELKEKFIAYYLKHYSVMISKGARDEWNIVQMLGEQPHHKPRIRQGFRNYWSRTIKPTVSPGYQQNLPQPTPTRPFLRPIIRGTTEL